MTEPAQKNTPISTHTKHRKSSDVQFKNWSHEHLVQSDSGMRKHALVIADISNSFSWPDFETVRRMVNHLTQKHKTHVSLVFANEQSRYARLCSAGSMITEGDRVLFNEFGGQFDLACVLDFQLSCSVKPYDLVLVVSEGMFDENWAQAIAPALNVRGANSKDSMSIGLAITSPQRVMKHRSIDHGEYLNIQVFDACLLADFI